MVLGIFKVALRLRGGQDVTITVNFECFQYFTLKLIFWKTKAFFKTLDYRRLVKRTNIEKKSFPYKTAMTQANVNYTWREKPQKRLIKRIFENIILATSDYIIVKTIK